MSRESKCPAPEHDKGEFPTKIAELLFAIRTRKPTGCPQPRTIMAPSQSKLTSGHAQWGKLFSPLPPKVWPATNYYQQHATKSAYDHAFAEARDWKIANPTELFTTAARIYSVKEEALKKSINRLKNRVRNSQGRFNSHGGTNKVLSEGQDEALLQYCLDQWELGLGATHDMVYAAICHLKTVNKINPVYFFYLQLQVQFPDRPTPTRRWFQTWLKAHPKLHTIKTKLIAHARLDTHTEEDVRAWFGRLEYAVNQYKIKSPRNILNMDESGARVGCPAGEQVIVPIQVKELYTASPENRKSVTILETIYADGREPLPPFIIAPGTNIMENWIAKELKGEEVITCTPTGYINNDKIMEYAEHLVKHTRAGPTKPWKILLLDSHESHVFPPFQLKCAENHIHLFYYPSNLTHALQPLDVGIFRPWKHYHNLAIQAALRSLDFEYTVTSFFRDLTKILTQTFKQYTIVNAFKTSGMYPVCVKAGITKMREYKKNHKKRKAEDITDEAGGDDEQVLPVLPLPSKDVIWEATAKLVALGEKDPTQFSDNAIATFKDVVKAGTVQLFKAHLTTLEHSALQEKIKAESKRKRSSRRSIQKGGSAASTRDLREKIRIRDERESGEALRKAEKKLVTAINKATNTLHTRGVQARKDEKARKDRLKMYAQRKELPPPEDLIPVRDPEKKPTVLEQAMCSEEAFPELLLQVREAQAQAKFVEPKEELEIRLGDHYSEVIGDYTDSEPPEEDWIGLKDSSDLEREDAESDNGSIDSIAHQADFIEF